MRSISGIGFILCMIVAIWLFLLPTILAKRDRLPIFVLNMFGLLLIPWVIALVLAIQSRREARLENLMLSAQPQSAPRYYGQFPNRPFALSAWVLTPLVACALLGLMYLAARYLRDVTHTRTPEGISRRSSHPKPKSKASKRQDQEETPNVLESHEKGKSQ